MDVSGRHVSATLPPYLLKIGWTPEPVLRVVEKRKSLAQTSLPKGRPGNSLRPCTTPTSIFAASYSYSSSVHYKAALGQVCLQAVGLSVLVFFHQCSTHTHTHTQTQTHTHTHTHTHTPPLSKLLVSEGQAGVPWRFSNKVISLLHPTYINSTYLLEGYDVWSARPSGMSNRKVKKVVKISGLQ
jgi:hypothetical protein